MNCTQSNPTQTADFISTTPFVSHHCHNSWTDSSPTFYKSYPFPHIKSFIFTPQRLVLLFQLLLSSMSSACDTCDCADKSNCTKKRNGFGMEIVEKNYNVSFELEVAENDCKCGPSCTCTTCTCHSA